MIGSEGTLGFISEVTYRTVEDPPHTACALVYFRSIETACRATASLKLCPVSAVELMDARALRLMSGHLGVPDEIPEGTVALLVDVRAGTSEQLQDKIHEVGSCLETFDAEADFTKDAASYANLWKIRKGLFPIVGAHRKTGTTVIIEDICFPLSELAKGTLALQKLLNKYDYTEAVIFGHALEGNLHFVFTQNFNIPEDVLRYDSFMRELSTLVCSDFSGSLKAEHGTGRNMAPFVEVEWGHAAYNIMRRIKKLFDPANILNPDVIISTKPELHIKSLKQTPAADPLIDKCIECGFCEPVCPSRDITITPRQRISLWREIQHRHKNGWPDKNWAKSFQYQGLDTCAGDGMCSTRCPVDIDTGELIKQLRKKKHTSLGHSIAEWTGDHFDLLCRFARTGLMMAGVSRKIIGTHSINDFPNKTSNFTRPDPKPHLEDIVYFNSCIHRVMAPESGNSQFNVVCSLLSKARYNVILPSHSGQLCCGLPYESKGYDHVAATKMNELKESLLELSDGGRLPIICDNSPCSYLILRTLEETSLQIFDAPSFFAGILDRFTIEPSNEPIMIYSVCSQKKAGETNSLLHIAQACSTQVTVAENIACCGFGGDRGFSHPELNASALRGLADQASGCCSGYSSSRTCEIGLKEHSGIPFHSILELLDRQSVKKASSNHK